MYARAFADCIHLQELTIGRAYVWENAIVSCSALKTVRLTMLKADMYPNHSARSADGTKYVRFLLPGEIQMIVEVLDENENVVRSATFEIKAHRSLFDFFRNLFRMFF